VVTLAQDLEVLVRVGPAFLEGQDVIDMGLAAGDDPAADGTAGTIADEDPLASGPPVGGPVVGSLFGRRDLEARRPPAV
jgi:hypothetical protein